MVVDRIERVYSSLILMRLNHLVRPLDFRMLVKSPHVPIRKGLQLQEEELQRQEHDRITCIGEGEYA
jgi:hypothetical protein